MQLPEIAAREDTKLERQGGEDRRRVHIGEVVAGVNGDWMIVDDVESCDVDR